KVVQRAPLPCEVRTRRARSAVPRSILRSPHGYVDVTIAIIVGRYRVITATRPDSTGKDLLGQVEPVRRAVPDVPRPVRRPPKDEVCLAVVVPVPGHGDITITIVADPLRGRAPILRQRGAPGNLKL